MIGNAVIQIGLYVVVLLLVPKEITATADGQAVGVRVEDEPDVTDHGCLAKLETKHVAWVDTRVDAPDDLDAAAGPEGKASEGAAGGVPVRHGRPDAGDDPQARRRAR